MLERLEHVRRRYEELTRLLDVLDGILGRGLRRQHVGIVPQNHFDQEDVA